MRQLCAANPARSAPPPRRGSPPGPWRVCCAQMWAVRGPAPALLNRRGICQAARPATHRSAAAHAPGPGLGTCMMSPPSCPCPVLRLLPSLAPAAVCAPGHMAAPPMYGVVCHKTCSSLVVPRCFLSRVYVRVLLVTMRRGQSLMQTHTHPHARTHAITFAPATAPLWPHTNVLLPHNCSCCVRLVRLARVLAFSAPFAPLLHRWAPSLPRRVTHACPTHKAPA